MLSRPSTCGFSSFRGFVILFSDNPSFWLFVVLEYAIKGGAMATAGADRKTKADAKVNGSAGTTYVSRTASVVLSSPEPRDANGAGRRFTNRNCLLHNKLKNQELY